MELPTVLTMFPTIQFSRKIKKKEIPQTKNEINCYVTHTHTQKNPLSIIRLGGNGNSNHCRQRKTHLGKNRN